MLRRRISEVITKLDEVLVKREEVATCSNNEESLSSLKERLELLISENHHLRDLLANKEREVNCLSLQVSEAAEKMKELCEERRMLLDANQEREHKQQLESMAVNIREILDRIPS
ncbi:hypothetical protein C1H46_039115 [Malus baccata]|uniref:Uncharacterized protein n=1 Tax=Malus baccata TaxID=106549 RepID=A0A540KMA6_MALBA|nr:hypothetical protein C1H46_039115 [Malus baccata]